MIRTFEAVAGTVWIACLAAAPAPGVASPWECEDPPADDVLRGPALRESTEGTASLVRRDFSGSLVLLEERPESAALDLLGLDPEQRAGADKVAAERAARVGSFAIEHYGLFLRIQAALQGGEQREAAPLLRELNEAAKELLNPPLADQVARALPEPARDRYLSIVREYKEALAGDESFGRRGSFGRQGDSVVRDPVADSTGRDGDGGSIRPGPLAMRRVEITLLLREMGGSFSAFVAQGRESIDVFLKAIDATPEQDNRIRGYLREFAAETNYKPTAGQRATLGRRIAAELTPEQRRKALRARLEE